MEIDGKQAEAKKMMTRVDGISCLSKHSFCLIFCSHTETKVDDDDDDLFLFHSATAISFPSNPHAFLILILLVFICVGALSWATILIDTGTKCHPGLIPLSMPSRPISSIWMPAK
jgi:hypothetical protein